MGTIKDAGVYYNEAIPTYDSEECVSERESKVGMVIAIVAFIVCLVFLMCFMCICYFYNTVVVNTHCKKDKQKESDQKEN